jgi:peroxiredoxin Q/BCP
MTRPFNELAHKFSEAWIRATRGRFTDMPVKGDLAPDFQLPDQHGQRHRLSDYRGRWVVLYFYPKDDTPGCTTEACRFQERRADMATRGADVLGISTDDQATHRRFADRHQLSFVLLDDSDGIVSRQYGVLFSLWRVKFARRRTFLIDPLGRVAKVYLRVAVDRHSDEVMADLDSLTGGQRAVLDTRR